MAVATANPLNSYLPAERREAAHKGLADAVAAHDQILRESLATAETDPDELAILKERVQGAKAEVGNWERYIHKGCPRAGAR